MPSVIISSYLTFTSERLDQVPTITFTNGAIAGQEVVTVTGHSNISVSIQSGVTTMLQVKNAIENSTVTTGFSASQLVSVSITSGHNSDPVETVVNAKLEGGITAPAGLPGGYLGRAVSFSVLAETAITNTGFTVLSGDIGISPGTSITGFPPGTYAGALHQTDTAAANALTDTTAAAAALTLLGPGTDLSSTDLHGLTLSPGVYHTTSTATFTSTGVLTLDAAGDPNALFVFLIGTSLTMGANCSIVLLNNANVNNVYFVTGTTFIFGANCTVNGNILAGTSITFASNSILNGRALVYGPSGAAVTFPSAGQVVTTLPIPAVSPSANAFAIIGPILYMAVAPGSAGNLISVSYTDGAVAGSEIVTVVGNAITVQVSDVEPALRTFITDGPAEPEIQKFAQPGVDYSTATQVITAIRNNPSASALVTAIYWILGGTTPIYADAAESPARFLTGGTDGAPVTITLEGLTITSKTNDATQNGALLTFTTGATAGSEVVTVTGNNVSVQISNGISTITQVRTALNAAPSFSAKYTATGTSSTPVYTVNVLPLV
jgi:hypothetical protein